MSIVRVGGVVRAGDPVLVELVPVEAPPLRPV